MAGGKAKSGMQHADAWRFDFASHTWKQLNPRLYSNPARPLIVSLGSQAIEKDGRIVIFDLITGKQAGWPDFQQGHS